MKTLWQTILLIITLSIGLIGFESCYHCQNIPNNTISDYARGWIGYANSTVIFQNDSSEVKTWNYSPINDQSGLKNYWSEERCGYEYGEIISLNLSSQNDSVVFNYQLVSEARNKGCETLTIAIEKMGVNLGQFSFTPLEDTAFSCWGDTITFFEQVDLNGKTFEKVYSVDMTKFTSCPITKCYFTKLSGIVGYKKSDGITWALL